MNASLGCMHCHCKQACFPNASKEGLMATLTVKINLHGVCSGAETPPSRVSLDKQKAVLGKEAGTGGQQGKDQRLLP